MTWKYKIFRWTTTIYYHSSTYWEVYVSSASIAHPVVTAEAPKKEGAIADVVPQDPAGLAGKKNPTTGLLY